MNETFANIFTEYYSIFRGRATSIPTYGDREFNLAIGLANNAIRKWDRADGQLWRELEARAQDQTTGVWATIQRSILDGTLGYTAPNNMRKPPAYVWFYNGTQQKAHKVSNPEDADGRTQLDDTIIFTGGANTGYTMVVGAILTTQYAGWSIDYIYTKKPTLMTLTSDPSALVPDMSDVNFMIQDMVATRAAESRNGFLYKTSKADAQTSLANMKIENNSGTYGNTQNALDPIGGWGSGNKANDIRL
jgi:hypothetical protein